MVTDGGGLGRNKRVVSSFFDRMSAGEIDAAFEHLSPGATWFSLGSRQHADAWAMKPTIERVFSALLQGPIQQKALIGTAGGNGVAWGTEGTAVTIADVT